MLLYLPLFCIIVEGVTPEIEITMDVISSMKERNRKSDEFPVFFWFVWPDEAFLWLDDAPDAGPSKGFGNGLYKMKVPGTLAHVFHHDDYGGHTIIFNQTDMCWHYGNNYTIMKNCAHTSMTHPPQSGWMMCSNVTCIGGFLLTRLPDEFRDNFDNPVKAFTISSNISGGCGWYMGQYVSMPAICRNDTWTYLTGTWLLDRSVFGFPSYRHSSDHGRHIFVSPYHYYHSYKWVWVLDHNHRGDSDNLTVLSAHSNPLAATPLQWSEWENMSGLLNIQPLTGKHGDFIQENQDLYIAPVKEQHLLEFTINANTNGGCGWLVGDESLIPVLCRNDLWQLLAGTWFLSGEVNGFPQYNKDFHKKIYFGTEMKWRAGGHVPYTVLSASDPPSQNPLYWEEWDNWNGSLSIKQSIMENGYHSTEDKLFCFDPPGLPPQVPQLKQLKMRQKCNGKKDCLAGVDERGCPLYTSNTLLLTLGCSCGIVLMGCLVGWVVTHYLPHWFKVSNTSNISRNDMPQLSKKELLSMTTTRLEKDMMNMFNRRFLFIIRKIIFLIKLIKEPFLFTLDIVQDVIFYLFLSNITENTQGILFISCLIYIDLASIIFAQENCPNFMTRMGLI